jgi:DNA replication initiation complex subunit (GINS family)
MEVITFGMIRQIHREEKNSVSLQKLPENFFALVRNWLSEKEKLYESSKNPEVLMEIENAKKILKDLISRREKKIVISALNVIRGGLPPENMTSEEEELFNKLVNLLNTFRYEIEFGVIGDGMKEKIEEIKENLQELRKSEVEGSEEEKRTEVEDGCADSIGELQEGKLGDENLIKIKILSNIPRFVDDDLRSYGPYNAGEVVELPKDIANILISRKIAEAV